MHKQIYVNLAVHDLARAKTFFTQLGLSFEPKFTNDKGACLIISDNIYAMLLVKDFFQTFTGKPVCDAHRNTEVLLCLSCESRSEVDQIVAKAVAAGGKAPRAPQEHAGIMYGHGFEDPDGHIWELVYMEPNAVCPA